MVHCNDQYFRPEGLHGGTIRELDNLGKYLSNSLVEGFKVKVLTNNPLCGSGHLSKIPSIGH